MAKKLSEAELQAIIANQIELAKDHDKRTRATSRDKALDYYFGNMDSYVPPEANRSKVVSRDVADAMGWIIPQLMRIFTASGRMFVAEPVEVGDLQYADQVTDGINYIFWKDNKGYEVVYAATWDSLLHGDGIVKTFYDETPVYSPAETIEGLSEDQRALLMNAGEDESGVEVMTHTARKVMVPLLDEMGQPIGEEEQTVYDLKVRRKKADGRFVVVTIPPEDFLIDEDATSVEEAAFKSHWQRKTRSDLLAMGYSKEDVWAIPEASRNDTAEAQARRLAVSSEATDKSMEKVDYYECFVMVDADGDGEAELIRACHGGGTNGKLLDWEVWEDEDPFDNIPCEPIPHRWNARSIADEEIDIQDVKTVLTRQLLNNTYWVNNPQRFVTGKVKNPDQMDNPTFGGTVFGDAGTTVTDLPIPYIGDKALMGINYMDEVSARRVGVTKQSMALDPETLQNQSATANQNAEDASKTQPEMIARNMAEFGWQKVGRKLLRLMHKRQAAPRTILVKGKPEQIDPRTWNPDMHVTVNTGLGTGSRDRDAGMLNTVLQQQIAFTDRIGAVFPEKGLDMLPYIHNTLTRFAESTGLKSPELYWPEIDPNEIEQGKAKLAEKANQPPPEVMLEQMKQQGAEKQAQTDAQVTMQVEQGKNQLAMQQAQIDSEAAVRREQAQLEADMITKDKDRENAIIIEQVRQQGAMRLKMMDIEYQREKDANAAQLQRESMMNSASMNAENNAARAAQTKPNGSGKPA